VIGLYNDRVQSQYGVAPQQQEQQFTPKITQVQLQQYISTYQGNPRQFSNEQLEYLKEHAQYYNVPFAEDEDIHNVKIKNLVRQLGEGYVSGFTTLQVGEVPDNKWERIARNVGSLAGFVGFVPYFPVKTLGPIASAAKMMKGRSVPMVAANYLTKKAGKLVTNFIGKGAIGKAAAAGAAKSFLSKELISSIAKHSFHLGTASAVSSWQGGVDEMMKGFVGGAQTGAAFGAIGNMINIGDPTGNKTLRGLASSAYMGLPSTMRGDSTPEQVYEYLLGGWFGWHSKSAAESAAGQVLNEARKTQVEPAAIEKYNRVSEKAKRIIDTAWIKYKGSQSKQLTNEIAKMIGVKPEDVEARLSKFKDYETKLLNNQGQILSEEAASARRAETNNKSSQVAMYEDMDLNMDVLKTLSQSIKGYTQSNLKHVYEVKGDPAKTYTGLMETAVKVQAHWNDITEVYAKDNNAYRMIDWLKTNFELPNIETKHKDLWMRNGLMAQQNRHTPVAMIVIDEDGLTVDFKRRGEAISNAGNEKNLYESRKVIDDVFLNETIRETGAKPANKRPAYYIIDNITQDAKTGGLEDITLMDKKEAYKRADPENKNGKWKKFIGSIIRQMDDKGYYYMGGKGDNQKQFYVSYHPAVANSGIGHVNTLYAKYKRAITKTKGYSAGDILKSEKFFTQSDYGKTLTNPLLSYRKMVLSNAFYETARNGLLPKMSSIQEMFRVDANGDYVHDYVSDAISYNKRSQIWFTSGYAPEQRELSNIDGTFKTQDNKLGFKAAIFREKYLNKELVNNDTNATDMPQHTDGSTLVRGDVIDKVNRSFGMDVGGRTNKNFIVSKDGDMGALLGKHMFEEAGPRLSAEMKKKGIHFLLPESSAKQRGLRELSDVTFKNGVIEMTSDNMFNIMADDIRGILTERMDIKTNSNTKLPKQMFTNLSPYMFGSEGNPEAITRYSDTISDMMNTLVRGSIKGKLETNKLAKKYADNLTDTDMQKDILKNIENIGITELFELINKPGAEDFASKAILKIADVNSEFLSNLIDSGEITKKEHSQMIHEHAEYATALQRHLKFDKGTMAVLYHKYPKKFIDQTLRNFVVNRATRVNVGNGMKLRMRSYQWELQDRDSPYGETYNLNRKIVKKGSTLNRLYGNVRGDNLFFMYEGDRNRIVSFQGEKMKLGNVWDNYVDGKYEHMQETTKEFFRSVAMRVPMDSMSGAQVLKFGGFTGLRGSGVLLHPNKMELLGGADLDGDTSFVFFGGRGETGSGNDANDGFRKSWKDLYAEQGEEFINQKTNKQLHNKSAIDPETGTTYHSQLAVTDPKYMEYLKNPSMRFDPMRRMAASEGASGGRLILGPAVVSKAVLNSAYANLMARDNKMSISTWWEKDDNGKRIRKLYTIITPKDSPTARKRFQQMSRAQIALGSDPMDEAGLKGREVFFEKLFNTAFEMKVTTKVGNKYIEAKNVKTTRDQRRTGIVDFIQKTNSALYGRDNLTGRPYSSNEIYEILMDSGDISNKEANTFLPKLARELSGKKFNLSILDKVDSNFVMQRIADFSKMVQSKEYSWTKNLLNRSSLDYEGKFLKKFFEKADINKQYNMWDPEIFSKIWNSSQENMPLYNFFNKFPHISGEYGYAGKKSNKAWRKKALVNLIDLGEDSVVRFLADSASVMMYPKVINAFKDASGRHWKEQYMHIHKAVEELRLRSWLNNKRQTGRNANPDEFMFSEPENKKYYNLIELEKKSGIFKNKLSPEGKRLFDALMVGTYNRGSEFTLNQKTPEGVKNKKILSRDALAKQMRYIKHKYRFIKGETKEEGIRRLLKLKQEKNYLNYEFNKGVDTKLSKLAWSLGNTDDRVLEEYQDIYNKQFIEVSKKTKLEPTEITRIEESNKSIHRLIDKEGKVSLADSAEYYDYDEKQQQFLRDTMPFLGLNVGKLTDKVGREIFTKVKENMEWANSKGTDWKKDMSEVFISMTGKSLNSMVYEDWRVVNRTFDDMRKHFLANKFRKSDRNGIEYSRWYHVLFPERVNRELMTEGFTLMSEDIAYKTPYGIMIGESKKPTHVIGQMQEWFYQFDKHKTRATEEYLAEHRKKLSPYVGGLKEGLDLHRIATSERYDIGDLQARYPHLVELNKKIAMYQMREHEVKTAHDWRNLKNKKFTVYTAEGTKELTGKEIVSNINKIYAEGVEKNYAWLEGDPKFLNEFTFRDKRGFLRHHGDGTSPVLNLTMKDIGKTKSFLKYMSDRVRMNKPIPLELGAVGGSLVTKSSMLQRLDQLIAHNPDNIKTLKQLREAINLKEVKHVDAMRFEKYWMHRDFDIKTASIEKDKLIKNLIGNAKTKPEKIEAANKIMRVFKRLTGDIPDMKLMYNELGEDAIDTAMMSRVQQKQRSESTIKWLNMNSKIGNMMTREFDMPGWSLEPEAYEGYVTEIIGNHYKQMSQVASRWALNKFVSGPAKNWAPDIRNAWVNHLKLYVQAGLGNPAVIPQYMVDDPSSKLKHSILNAWSDNNVANTIDRMGKKLGLKKSKLPAEYRELEKISPQQVMRWSNYEAQYQTATLLAHPKASMNNLLGGTTLTIINTGFKHFRNARNLSFLQNTIDRNFDSMDKVYDWVREIGVYEQWMMHELHVNPKFKSAKMQRFGKEIIGKLRQDPNMKNITVKQIMKKHKILETGMSKAAWFMQRAERTLRRDSFIAHYLQALENFGGVVKDPKNNPYLVRMAEKGVEATQFLYDAPFKPLFSTTALGKVMTRFQQWAWKSVQFRNETIRKAHIMGWREGTQEFDRYKRMATADLMMIGFANVFAYSIFDSTLPTPYSWLQDWADLLFGDEAERDRAFFGVYPGMTAPLQMTTPPALRMVGPTLGALIKNDFKRYADYHVWTMFPFGRIGRDIYGTAKKPRRIVEKTTGIPLDKLMQEKSRLEGYQPLYPGRN